MKECCEGVLWRSVVVKRCGEVLWRSVVKECAEKCCGEVL